MLLQMITPWDYQQWQFHMYCPYTQQDFFNVENTSDFLLHSCNYLTHSGHSQMSGGLDVHLTQLSPSPTLSWLPTCEQQLKEHQYASVNRLLPSIPCRASQNPVITSHIAIICFHLIYPRDMFQSPSLQLTFHWFHFRLASWWHGGRQINLISNSVFKLYPA